MPEGLQLSTPRESVAVLSLARPEVLNALSDEVVAQLDAMLAGISRDSTCKALVITGEGRAFCAGFDLRLAGSAPGQDGEGEAAAWLRRQEAFAGLVTRLRSLPQPVIAAVNGAASGGGFALALGCDIRIASASAVFHAAFVKIGMSGCDMGMSWLLPRCVGASHSFHTLLAGRSVGSEEALRIGLVSERVEDARLQERALEIAGEIAANDALALWLTKRGAWANLEAASLQAAIELENRSQMLARTTGGLAAAAQRFQRKP